MRLRRCVLFAVLAAAAAREPVAERGPLAHLSRERSRVGGAASLFRAYHPPLRVHSPGGDLEDAATLPRVLPSASADGEVMLLCVGGEGSMRTGVNIVLSFRAMRLYHMLVLAPDRANCLRLWEVVPTLACVWWPQAFARPVPDSLYNTQFKRTALAFFEARKILLERLVVSHRLNVLHLDADCTFFANPYPTFKGLYADANLIVQPDNPFANAGVFYVQNVRPGDATAWVLEELNRRIHRFTYHPESVRQLPHSGWSRPPHFANADEQANLNDVLTSALTRKQTYASGVEFAEARFKERFAPRRCNGRRKARDDEACAAVEEARQLMKRQSFHRQMNEGDVGAARRALRPRVADRGSKHARSVHVCSGSIATASEATLGVPGNTSAPSGKLVIAPQWLFSHFPYGDFFPAFKQCHESRWAWQTRSDLERRLCMPEHRVPCIGVHMAGLRQEAWGRRTLMRALGVWQDAADAVAPEAWVSSRAQQARHARTPAARRRAWAATGSGRLLLLEGAPLKFSGMAEYDHFAARFLLIGLLTNRRVVFPPVRCGEAWVQKALQGRHLRAFESGCGADRQCIWLPYPHHIDAWCAGVDWLWDIDYRAMLARGDVKPSDVGELPIGGLGLDGCRQGDCAGRNATITAAPSAQDASRGRPLGRSDGPRVLKLRASRLDGAKDPFDWLPIAGFTGPAWTGALQRRVEAVLRDPAGLALSDSQVEIVRTCLKSEAASRE